MTQLPSDPSILTPAPSIRSVAIQGERGSNSHMAALEMLGSVAVVPCALSAQVLEAVVNATVDAAVLPIENSLHGSVHEHYDLLLQLPVRIDHETLLRIHHNLLAAPGVSIDDLRQVLSHPVALSQCRRFLSSLNARSVPFYDTAGSVKHLIAEQLHDTAGIAPALAAHEYGGHILAANIEDHTENFTRFHLITRSSTPAPAGLPPPNKLSAAFSVENRPGSLVTALQRLSETGVDLTKIESRPVPGKPWEYIFYVDFRFDSPHRADAALAALHPVCHLVKELGRYAAA
jgi:prephenate dehydratase